MNERTIDTRLFEAVPANQPSCHFSISAGQRDARAAGHAMAACHAAPENATPPKAAPPSPYRGTGSHIGAGWPKVGQILASNNLPVMHGVGGW